MNPMVILCRSHPGDGATGQGAGRDTKRVFEPPLGVRDALPNAALWIAVDVE